MALTKEQKEAKIDDFIAMGEALIYPSKIENWKECVRKRIDSIYDGKELENVLEVIKILDSGKGFDEAKKAIDDKGHSGMSYSITLRIITQFSSQGPAFFRYIEPQAASEHKTTMLLKELE